MKVTQGEANCFSNQVLVFNELPKSVRCSPTVNSFKHKAKQYYIDKAFARQGVLEMPAQFVIGRLFVCFVLFACFFVGFFVVFIVVFFHVVF